MKPELSIILPCYNEAENIPIVIEKFEKALFEKSMKKSVELIIVDNNSTDNSAEIIKKLLKNRKYKFARSVFQEVPGFGSAVIKGLKSARGEFLCWTHADLQTDPKDCIKALEIMQKQENKKKIYIKGNRHERPFFDKFFEFGMSIFESIILRTYLYDINAQPNLFHNSFLGLMKNPPNDFSFDLYVYYLAKTSKYKIIRFPVLFPKRIHGESKWNAGDFKSKYKFIKRTLNFSFKLKRFLREK